MTRFVGYRLNDRDDLMIRCECGTLYKASEHEVTDLIERNPDVALRLAWNAPDARPQAA